MESRLPTIARASASSGAQVATRRERAGSATVGGGTLPGGVAPVQTGHPVVDVLDAEAVTRVVSVDERATDVVDRAEDRAEDG